MYSEDLELRPFVVVGNKIDELDAFRNYPHLREGVLDYYRSWSDGKRQKLEKMDEVQDQLERNTEEKGGYMERGLLTVPATPLLFAISAASKTGVEETVYGLRSYVDGDTK